MGAMPIAEFGTDAQQAAWLPRIAEGSLLCAAALYEQGTTPGEPLTTARTDGDGFVLDGVKPMVDQGLEAGLLVVPARLDNGSVGVFLVPTDADGVTRQRVEVTTGRPQAHVTLAGVAVGAEALLGGPDEDAAAIIRWIEQRPPSACACSCRVLLAPRSSSPPTTRSNANSSIVRSHLPDRVEPGR